MTTFIDTSVLIPLLSEESPHHAWCMEKINKVDRPIIVSDIVYAELSVGMNVKDEVDAVIAEFSLGRQGYSDQVLFRAARAFRAYKDNKGQRDSLLPDFLIGALAEIEGEPLLTRDPTKVRTYFPDVMLIHPE